MKYKLSQWKTKWNWSLFLIACGWIGFFLRYLFVEDMEYKEDEEYNFIQSQRVGVTEPWPWYGIPSGVYLVNPGMSVWIFVILAKLFRIHEPTALAHAVQVFAFLGMSLIIPFALYFVEKKNQKAWFWAFALAMVNPFLVFYQRKLWPEPLLPFFTMLTLMGWWKRKTFLGAFFWGMVGAISGQIHMSGFFFSAGLFLWTLFFDSKEKNWKAWFLGSVLGSLPLIPWLIFVLQHPLGHAMSSGVKEAVQLKYWVFWITDGLGLHLGNPLGLLRGPSHWDQISDFVRYPLLAGQATYLTGLAHLIVFFVASLLLFKTSWSLLGVLKKSFQKGFVKDFQKNFLKNFPKNFKATLKRNSRSKQEPTISIQNEIIGTSSETAFVQNSAFFGCGILLTITGVMIRRYYMTVTFPLEFIFWIQMAKPESKLGHRLLVLLWIGELLISANFVGYIHANHGSIQGDYGPGYSSLHQ